MLLLLLSCTPEVLDRTSPASPARGAWTVEKLLASDASGAAFFGTATDGAGDLDGDGFDDLVVGAAYDEAAYVYYGSASGLTDEEKFSPPVDGFSDFFGIDAASPGDIDGDGYDDLLVGAPYDSDESVTSGALFVYRGSASGLVTTTYDKVFPSLSNTSQYFANRVEPAGDINADGFPDVIVSGAGNDTPAPNAGVAYVFYGSTSGLGSEQLLVPSDAATNQGFSFSVAGAGDINSDGFDDVLVGSPGPGTVGSAYVYYGSATGLVASSEDKLEPSDAPKGNYFGYAAAGAGDLNGDGYADIAVGTYPPAAEGAVYVYYGSATGIAAATELKLTASDGGPTNFFGWWLSDAGDFDRDGFDDLIVGAPYDSEVASNAGAAYIYYGSATGLAVLSEEKLTAPDGGSSSGYFGWSADSAGDLDGDGTPDLVIGAYGDSEAGAGAGAAYVYYGTCTDADSDTLCADEDCDDSDALVGGPSIFYADTDSDGYGDPASTATGCTAPSGYVSDATDCLDSEPDAFPGNTEVCDGIDNDCDGEADNSPADATTFYTDADGDGYGDPDSPITGCEAPSGAVADSTDCLDTDATVYPGATEIPDDGIDQDCSGADLTTEPEGDSGGEAGDTGAECAGMGWSCRVGPAAPAGWLVPLLLLWCRRR